MRSIRGEGNLYWLAGKNQHGAILDIGSNGITRIVIQTAGHPGKHVVLALDEFDHLVTWVAKYRGGVVATLLGDTEAIANA